MVAAAASLGLVSCGSDPAATSTDSGRDRGHQLRDHPAHAGHHPAHHHGPRYARLEARVRVPSTPSSTAIYRRRWPTKFKVDFPEFLDAERLTLEGRATRLRAGVAAGGHQDQDPGRRHRAGRAAHRCRPPRSCQAPTTPPAPRNRRPTTTGDDRSARAVTTTTWRRLRTGQLHHRRRRLPRQGGREVRRHGRRAQRRQRQHEVLLVVRSRREDRHPAPPMRRLLQCRAHHRRGQGARAACSRRNGRHPISTR